MNSTNNEELYKKAGDLLAQGKVKDSCMYLEKAVKGGHIEAHTDLAHAYAYGFGVESDMEKAIELWRFAAENDDKNACFSLYDIGSGTSLVSSTEATEMLKKAAKLGHSKAIALMERWKQK